MVTAIAASPKSDKLTHFALNQTLTKIKQLNHSIDVKLISLSSMNISACKACDHCNSNYACIIEDDFNAIVESFKDTMPNALIIESPVYMGSISAQVKSFIDRTVLFRINNFAFKNIIGSAITVGGSRNGGQELAIQSIHTNAYS